jgi:hypothetical protein
LAHCANSALHVFDSSVMPPKQLTSIKVRDCVGWLSFRIDGRFAYGSTGEIIDVARRKSSLGCGMKPTETCRARTARLDNRERQGGSSGKSVRHRHEAEVNQFGLFSNPSFAFGDLLLVVPSIAEYGKVAGEQDTIYKRCTARRIETYTACHIYEMRYSSIWNLRSRSCYGTLSCRPTPLRFIE